MNTPSEHLSVIQAWMQSALIDPEEHNDPSIVTHYIAPGPTLTPEERLAIYQRSYYSRLLECMRSQFKALHHTLGRELFDDFARGYLRQYPSASPGLADLGERFPDFLRQTRPDRDAPEKWVDFMIAMAQFECDLYRIFDRKGSEGEQFANQATRETDLALQACFELRQYPFDVSRYYQDVAAGNNPELPPHDTVYLAFIRTDYRVFIITLTHIQFGFLKLIADGRTVAEAQAAIVREYNLNPAIVSERWAQWKKEWTEKGFFLIRDSSSKQQKQ